jgi:predicted regulator of Ras-like GTPase activity (Roadblock/LC7/MglB family)
MKMPFLDLYLSLRNKARALRSSGATQHSPARRSTMPVAKPEGERLSKTVLPNMTRKLAPPDPLHVAAGLPLTPKVSVAASSRPRGSGSASVAWSRQSPTAIALAGERKTERAISIHLADILDQLPVGYLKSPETFDCDRSILLKASEIEKGMANGKPTVSLASIYQQAPEIFVHSPAPNDCTAISLPFGKVLTQFMSFQVRTDQVRDEIVPQLETPILQVTLEDTERFGTTIEPLQTSPLPPVRVETATAKSIAAAEPEATVSETVKPRALRPAISLLDPTPHKKDSSPTHVPLVPATRPTIPIDLPPNGTGAPASEIVPALSGPPVPTTSPPPPVVPRIPFRVTAPSEDIRPKFIRIPGTEPREEVALANKSAAAKQDEPKIALSLQAILHELPAFQLNGSPAGVSEDVRIELPVSLIEPQLASGRVVLSPTLLQKTMPENYRGLLKIDPVETPVVLPLHEILKNLPTGVLRMRPDQEETELGERFETPFSIKADEDAKRFQADAKAAAKPSEQPADEATAGAKSETKGGEKLDARMVVARANALPGVAACAITFADGLALAGKLPAELLTEGLCAMAPSILQKIDKHLLETKLGALTALTLQTAKAPLSFFMRGNIFLAVLHAGSELAAESRDQLALMIEELTHTYSESEPANVDH